MFLFWKGGGGEGGVLTMRLDKASSSNSLKLMAGSSSKCLPEKAPLRSIFLGNGPCMQQRRAAAGNKE